MDATGSKRKRWKNRTEQQEAVHKLAQLRYRSDGLPTCPVLYLPDSCRTYASRLHSRLHLFSQQAATGSSLAHAQAQLIKMIPP